MHKFQVGDSVRALVDIVSYPTLSIGEVGVITEHLAQPPKEEPLGYMFKPNGTRYEFIVFENEIEAVSVSQKADGSIK